MAGSNSNTAVAAVMDAVRNPHHAAADRDQQDPITLTMALPSLHYALSTESE